jgi:hypothetical protein
MKNARIWDWFNHGKIADALRGQNEFFIPGVTYRENHDEILVIGQLIAWAQETDGLEKATSDFESTVSELLNEGQVEKALGLVWSYLIVSRDQRSSLSLDMDVLQSRLAMAIRDHAREIASREEFRQLVLRVADRLPGLRESLGLKSTT